MYNIENEEYLSDLRDKLVDKRMQERKFLKLESVRVAVENIDESEYRYSYRDLSFNDDVTELLKLLLNSDYYIEIVFSILGIGSSKCKAYIEDFDNSMNTAEVEFTDLQYIAKINGEYEFYVEVPNKLKLDGFSRIDISTKILNLSNKVLISFDFSNDYGGNCKYNLSEIDFWNAKVYVYCDIYGLPTKAHGEQHNIHVTTWIEELIHSICLYESRDYKLAVATAVSAIDRFINDELKYIRDYYSSLDLIGQNMNYKYIISDRIKKLDSYINSNGSYLYKKMPEVMREYNFPDRDIEQWRIMLANWNGLRVIVAHALDEKIVDNNLLERDSTEFENGYKTLLYTILKFIYLIEGDGDIDDVFCFVEE